MIPYVSIILPTFHRATRLRECLESLHPTLPHAPIVETVALPMLDDGESFGMLDRMKRQFTDRDSGACMLKVIPRTRVDASAVQGWNYGLRRASHKSDLYVLAADDLMFRDGWLTNAIRALVKTGHDDMLIGFNDLSKNGKSYASHYMMTRKFIVRHHGGVMAIPHYHSWCIDWEAAARAKRVHRYLWAANSLVEHRHPGNRNAEMDSTYKAGYVQYADSDHAMYVERMKKNFPDDFPPILLDEGEYERETAPDTN